MAALYHNTRPSRKSFDIILDSPCAVFHGDVHEAEPVSISGTLLLDNAEHMSIKGIKITLEGKWRVSWTSHGSSLESGAGPTRIIREKGQILKEEKQLAPAMSTMASAYRIAPGRHEWRFDFILDPKLPESVEGLHGNYIVYNLTAEIERGYMSKSIVTSKHVRVIRTLSQDMIETAPFPYSNDETWADKIKYHVYIHSRYFAFGSTIPVEFTLLPLRKGVRIGKIKMEVLERVALEAHRESEAAQAMVLPDQTVAKVSQQMPQEYTEQLTDESTGIVDESYHFKVMLSLPTSLNRCRQSVSTETIKIQHNLKIYVNIHNPDGHISQLCLRNLVYLFIPPEVMINDDQTLDMRSRGAFFQPGEPTNTEVPPTYGSHLMDQLYQDIDPIDYLSGANTPANYLSRNQSMENLANRFAGATGLPHSSGSDTSRSSSVAEGPVSQLQSRLAALTSGSSGVPSSVTSPQQLHNDGEASENGSRRPSLRSGLSSLRSSFVLPYRNRKQSQTPSADAATAIDPCDRNQSSGPSTGPAHASHPPGNSTYRSLRYNGYDEAIHRAQENLQSSFGKVPSYNTAIRPGSENGASMETTSPVVVPPTYEAATSVTNTPHPSPP